MYDVILFTDQTDSGHRISITLGAFKLASSLRQHGYSTLVINHLSYYTQDELIELLDQAISDNTKLVGFSTTFLAPAKINDNGKVERLSSYLGEEDVFPQGNEFGDKIFDFIISKNPNIKFAVGASKMKTGWKHPRINFAFQGYAELGIIHLMQHITKGTNLPNSKVLEDGKVVVNDPFGQGYVFKENMMLWEDIDIVNHKVLPIEIGRGCIFKCKFCAFPLNGRRNVDYVKEENILYYELMDAYERFGITHYLIVDDTFNESIEKLSMVRDTVKRLPFQPNFWAFIRLELLCTKPETLEILYDMGVRAFFFGIETMDMAAGKSIGKGFSRERQLEMIRHIKDTYPDITTHGSFISGLPFETRESIHQTISQLRTKEIPLDSWNMNALHIAIDATEAKEHNSDFNLNYEKYGFKKLDIVGSTLIWENNQGIKFLDIREETLKEVALARQETDYYIPGGDCFDLVNFGYDLQYVFKQKLYGFDWEECDRRILQFVADYKDNLLDLVKTHRKNHQLN